MGKNEHRDPLDAGVADVGGAEEFSDGMVEIVNVSSMTAKFNLGKQAIVLPPKKTMRVATAYGVLRIGANPKGDKLPSVVATLTNDMVQPADETQRISKDGRTVMKAG